MEYDAPDRLPERRSEGMDQRTLHALEGRPTLEVREEREEERMRLLSRAMEQQDNDRSEDEGDEELQQATLISFDIEASDAAPSAAAPNASGSGSWSAELRSTNDMKASEVTSYRVTGLTMLPTILATEGLREVIAGLLVLPLESLMVRTIGRAYQKSAALDVANLYAPFSFGDMVPAYGNLFGAFSIQVVVTGAVWAGYTFGVWLCLELRRIKSEGTDPERSRQPGQVPDGVE